MADEITPEERIARHRARREAAAERARSGGVGNILKRYKLLIVSISITCLGLIGYLLPDTRTPEEKEAANRRFTETYLKVSCENLIKRNLRDPGSYQRKNWIVTDGVAYVSYRAKNGFGGYVLESKACSMDGRDIVIR